MWGNNQAIAPNLGATIIAVDFGDNFTVKGHHLLMIKYRELDERVQADPHKQWEDPKMKKQTMPTKVIKEEDIEKTTAVEVLGIDETINQEMKTRTRNLKKMHLSKFLKDLVSNKSKMEQISSAFLNEKCFAIVQNKFLPKLGDPGSFLVPCTVARSVEYLVLADLDASINLIPYSLYASLSGNTLKPTRMRCHRRSNGGRIGCIAQRFQAISTKSQKISESFLDMNLKNSWQLKLKKSLCKRKSSRIVSKYYHSRDIKGSRVLSKIHQPILS
nr:reverse transcriptase domain-containing protein [Tanacetum cinerariifolium]